MIPVDRRTDTRFFGRPEACPSGGNPFLGNFILVRLLIGLGLTAKESQITGADVRYVPHSHSSLASLGLGPDFSQFDREWTRLLVRNEQTNVPRVD